ncbi:MAG TPA: redoxin domain-containing protein [Candidatus Acidoferrales bacterium]|nr:redoxin domain-containing protein [Candidatus Acidoferrales bacterium]
MTTRPHLRLPLALAGILLFAALPELRSDDAAVATVKADTLDVHEDASIESEVVKTLKKGDRVVVGIQIQNSESIWCQVRPAPAGEWLGYVTCRQLDQPPPPRSNPAAAGESYAGVQILVGKSEHSKLAASGGEGGSSAPPVTDRRFLSRNVDAPDFALSDLDGNTHVLGSLRGSTVLLDFWATWCGPCREEMPQLEKLRGEIGGRGLTIWSINSGESPALVRSFFERSGYTGIILLDLDSRVNREYDARYIPTLVIVDPAGKVRFYDSGVYTARELRAILAQIGVR